MKRREFIKNTILGAAGIVIPLRAIPSEPPGEWIDVQRLHLAPSPLRVGDTVLLRKRQSFVADDLGNGFLQLQSPYDEYLITAQDISSMQVKVIRCPQP